MSDYYSEGDDEPQILESLDLDGIAKYIQSDNCKNIFIMAGAGISTSAGIPDFRSPETGLYANLARLRLPYPEAVFDITFFKNNPRPFYVLAHELAPGKFRPTLTHSFIRLLAEKSYLHTCFTQNIDTLERMAGVPGEKIVEAHGSFADQHCVKCHMQYPHDKIKKDIAAQEIPICERKGCRGYVKPDIVFFGESLPDEFTSRMRHLHDADLLIVMGTSLTVHPFANLTEFVPYDCPRLLLNLELVGGWGDRANDVACLMPCDTAVRLLCQRLGWEDELDKLWAGTGPPSGETVETDTAKEKLDEVVEELAEVVGTIKLGDSEGKDAIADSPKSSEGAAETTSQEIRSPMPQNSEAEAPATNSKDADGEPVTQTLVEESESPSTKREGVEVEKPSLIENASKTTPTDLENSVDIPTETTATLGDSGDKL